MTLDGPCASAAGTIDHRRRGPMMGAGQAGVDTSKVIPSSRPPSHSSKFYLIPKVLDLSVTMYEREIDPSPGHFSESDSAALSIVL